MKREIEINGIKFEVDMSTAKRIDTFKIGDNVKVLDKGYSDYKILDGVITAFVNFKDLPTIEVAVFESSWSEVKIRFIYINENAENYEITPSSYYESKIEKNKVVESLNREIETKKSKIRDLENKKNWFVKYYEKHFEKSELREDSDDE